MSRYDSPPASAPHVVAARRAGCGACRAGRVVVGATVSSAHRRTLRAAGHDFDLAAARACGRPRDAAGRPRPVATTVTRISSVISGSMTVADDHGGVLGGELLDRVADLVELADAQVHAGGDVDQDAVGAGEVDVLEQRARDRGLGRRARAVLAAWPAPEPIIAMPISDMTVRTSAKSTLIRPGRVISSAMPCTAPCSTSLAALKASSSVVSPAEHGEQLLVRDRDQRVDVLAELGDALVGDRRCACLPSIAKGLVTTATVRMPSSLATCATTGAAPVPVPPPMPAVMNTMSAPSRARRCGRGPPSRPAGRLRGRRRRRGPW